MAASKAAASVQMDYWREYFGRAKADIFEIIEGAIMIAASDYPKEFRIRRDGIAQILFSCKLVKCSGCDKMELAVPVNDDDEGVKFKSKLVDVDGNNHQVSNYSYGEAEALTDEIEEETQEFDEVMRIKEIVDNSPDESSSVLCNSLRKLQLMALSVETLKATEIGKSVNVLRKHASKDVRQIAKTLIEVWKDMVDEWVNLTTKMAVSEATPESMNPSVLDEEEGLPSPPLDDLAFLNPHTMSLELSEFFDGMDDFGSPGKSRGFNRRHDNSRKPAVEKQNVTKSKPSNDPMILPKESDSIVKKQEGLTKKQSTVVKPTKPPVAVSGRPMKLKTESKLQNSEKAIKPRASDEPIVDDKLEATKRKLQERYQQAENAKRQRTIQVMELQDLPKQGVAHMRPGHNHNRHWANGRR